MGNEVAERKSTALNALARGLKRTRQNLPSFGGKAYLKFGKDGEWTCGKGGDAMNEEVVVLNMLQLQTGYVCWTDYPAAQRKKNEKLGEEMQRVVIGEIDPGSLPDLGWPWETQMSVEGRFLTGDRKEFVYNTSSKGGLEALDGVFDAVMERVDAGSDFFFPMVKLLDDNYDHSQWGKTYKPIFEVVGWADEEGNPEEEANKPTRRKAVKKPEPEIEPEDEEPEIEPEDEEPEDEEPEDEPAADEPPVRRRRRR